jgi:hypothetical protein
MKKISIIFYLSLVSTLGFGQTNFVRPSIIVFKNTSKNLDSVKLPENFDRIFYQNNNLSFSNITNLDSVGLAKANLELMKNYKNIFKPSFETQLIGSDNKLDQTKIAKRLKNTMTKEQFEMSKSMNNSSALDMNNLKELFAKNYALLITENSYQSNYSDKTYNNAHKLNATIYVLKLSSFKNVINMLFDNNGNAIEINWSQIPDSLISSSIVSATNYETIIGPSTVPQGSSPLATAALEKTYAKLNKKFESYKEQDYINELFTSAVIAALEKANKKVIDFQVVAPVKSDHPISANIGKKEGLKIDNRYFVYEQEENEKGERKEVQVSTIRVRKVGDNMGLANDSSGYSKFYKIGGGNIEPGMYMRNKEDLGIGISLGYGNDSWLRVDYRLKGITPGLKLFLDANPHPGKVEIDREALKSYVGNLYGGFLTPQNSYVAVAYKFSLGVEKTMHLGSRFSLTPFVGGGKQSVTLTGNFADFSYFNLTETYSLNFDTKEGSIWDGYFVKGGIRTGIHLNSNLSLIGTASFNSTIIGGYNDPKIIDQYGVKFGYLVGGYDKEENQKILENELGKLLVKQPKSPKGLLWDICLRYEF